ncbi:MAG: amidohydrolase [Bacteroidetes bacterium]|nr:amidohydrolase [Bacteroidota bacterium]
MKKKYFVLIYFLIMLTISCSHRERSDLIIFNAHVCTLDDKAPFAESFAVINGKIAASGSNKEILKKFTSDQMIDAKEKYIFPGFIDGHCHFYGYGIDVLTMTNLRGTGSFQEILDILKKHHQNSTGGWIRGRGWDQNVWTVKQFPDKTGLDSVFPNIPVLITRVDGHAALANSEALKRAGIIPDTRVNDGTVEILNGQLTGILTDNAIDLVTKVIPETNRQTEIDALKTAQNDCFKYGLTMVADAGLSNRVINLIDSLQQAGIVKMRIDAMMEPSDENVAQFMDKGVYKTERLRVGSVKLYADGALGSRGAVLLEPYSDQPDSHGLMIESPAYYKTMCEKAYAANYQVNTHAIGDSGVRCMLHVYADILMGPNDRRWRIEHAQVVKKEDFKLFGQYHIIPSIQATHATSDMYWAEDRLGKDRIKGAYAYHDLLAQNGWLVNGTDFPVENINPLFTFYAAVTRKDLKGYPPGGFQPENALTREEALKSMTIWAAKGSFMENETGSIIEGKCADFVILDKDIMTIPEAEIPSVRVIKTFVNGELVFDEGWEK